MPLVIGIGDIVGGIAGAYGSGSRPSTNGFKYSVNTSNTDAGSSNADQHTLPVISTGTYSFDVDWGDGSSNTITAWNQAEVTHTYAASGTYTIEITGTFTGVKFDVDTLKLLEIFNWGGSVLTINDRNAFKDTTNASCSATDSPVLVGNLGSTFQGSTISSGLANWNFGSVTGFRSGLQSASSWNEDVSGWDVTACTNFGNTFLGTAMSQANYDALLIGWAAQTVQSSVVFATSAQYTAGGAAEAARNTLTTTYSWSISDGGPN